MVLTATVDGVDLVAVGWKQNRESNLYFIMTRGACSTLSDPNDPHAQHWTDDNRNAAERDLPRPKLASMYFKGSNAIDVHNHHRQGILELEKKWPTQTCWFRLFTTLVGICTVDALLMFKMLKPRLDEASKKTVTFAAILAKQLVDNEWDDGNISATNETPSQMPPPPLHHTGRSAGSQRPQSAPARTQVHYADRICELVKIVDEYGWRDGDKRKACHVCWEVHKKKAKTEWTCACFGKGVCGPNSGRACFEVHVGNQQRASAPENSVEILERVAERRHKRRNAREGAGNSQLSDEIDRHSLS